MARRCAILALLTVGAFAQAPIWGQCGGIGWTGPTTCVSGSACVKQNDYYSQCLPGASVPTSTTTSASATTSAPASPTGSGSAAACTALANQLSTLIPGYTTTLIAAKIYPKGSTFNEGTFDYATPVTNLAEFCRFGAFFNTSAKSQVKFEVWMPTTTWNGRFAFVGNGIAAGGVNYPSMGGALTNYGFAVASTNTGHEGSGLDGTFALNNPDSQIDFGYRAVHLSTLFSKNVVRAFYSATAFKSYWLGCSSGGKQGLKEVQTYPDDYDGVLAGSPAWWWSHLTAWTLMGGILNPLGKTGALSATDWQTVHTGIMAQCDALDGLSDGIITNPALCVVDWSKINLSAAQRTTAASLYANWTSVDGKLLFPGYAPGAEEGGLAGTTGFVFPFTQDYFKYQVLNYTSVAAAASVTFNETFLEHLMKTADSTNPGNITADNFDIAPFITKGGKLLQYVGTQDPLIPYGSSVYYHEMVAKTLGTRPLDAYRMFAVPGMGHCAGGNKAPSDFGGDPGASGTKPANFDAQHNAILALIQWVENGTAPDQIIGSGSGFSRPLCPYPKFAKYVSGDQNNASSFTCQ
ncbi:tannase-domain-containing protein [Exidia glandulosa HHB12029]|uniref:Carboxylic ester hydrolase n=1 Tax=Exidia glandulosa HHB12029 TaxID=1314781 RepID=A0A165E193_EXIGL|nr:tannase-domain-containing protein [Exidia glandulosa HHB12029]